MARFNKMQVLDAIVSTGMVPVYYNKDVEIAKQVVKLATKVVSVHSNSPIAVTSLMKYLPN